MNTDMVAREAPKAILLRPLVSPKELIEAHKEITELIAKALTRDVDYGIIPGTKKETLLKPGAERILKAFGCHAEYVIVTSEVDHDRSVEYQKMEWNQTQRRKLPGPEQYSTGLYRYVIECRVYSAPGVCVGSGIGSCSSMEAKYIDRPRDVENTILKMAQKRAKVAGVLDTFGLSDRFTQDMEDMTPEPQQESDEGYDPGNRLHQDWLLKQLKAKNVPDSRWDDVGSALRGRPASDLSAVMEAVLGP